jgi:hypothetical protein
MTLHDPAAPALTGTARNRTRVGWMAAVATRGGTPRRRCAGPDVGRMLRLCVYDHGASAVTMLSGLASSVARRRAEAYSRR